MTTRLAVTGGGSIGV